MNHFIGIIILMFNAVVLFYTKNHKRVLETNNSSYLFFSIGTDNYWFNNYYSHFLFSTIISLYFYYNNINVVTVIITILFIYIAFADFYTMKIPNYLMLPSMAFVIIYRLVQFDLNIKNLFISLSLLILIGIITSGAIGAADFKLIFTLFLLVNDPMEVFAVVLIGTVTYSIFSLNLMRYKLINRKTALPLGTFLVIGYITYLFIGV